MKFLDDLNKNYSRLHTNYEKLFWLSYMGDHSVDERMKQAQEKRDAFRADTKLKAETEKLIKTSKGTTKARLLLWKKFFDLYQVPEAAVPLKNKANDLEAQIHSIRSKRKEGYIDPATGKFVEASEIKMRMLMRTHPDESTRKACFEALEKLPLETLDLYVEMVKLRNDFAHLLGHEDFYAYKVRIDEDMTKDELFGIFEPIYERTKYAFEDVRTLEKQMPGLRTPWNMAYMMTGDFTKEEDQYFKFENVLDQWGRSFAAMGLSFNGGTVTLDLLDRKGKHNNGFCHYPDLVTSIGGKWTRGSSNFTSNAIPTQVGSGILGLHTVFHEGGHAMDRLNSRQPDTCVNHEYPPNTISWAETHSMFMEAVSSSIEWKTRYAKNAAGDSYPFSLFERKVRKLHIMRPLEMMNVMFMMQYEREIYECKNLTREFVLETARKVYRKYFDRTEDSITVLNVSHMYSWETSAYYHGYGLAMLGVDQWREYFYKKFGYIVDNPKVGKEMTKMWSYGSIYSAKKLMKMATGKPLSADAFIKDVTRPLEEVLERAEQKIGRLKKIPLYKKPVKLGGKIIMVHGKKKVADNAKSFEDMDRKYRAWLKTQ